MIDKKTLAEFFGTFALVFIGCGSAVLAGDQLGLLGVALAFGLTVTVMAYSLGNISGGHFNPAVTIALLFAKKFDPKDFVSYITAQILGAIVASALIYTLYMGLTDGIAANTVTEGYGVVNAFVMEVVVTMLFLMVILGSTDPKAPKGFAPIAIGLSLAILIFVSGTVTNASLNPARSIGPAIFEIGFNDSQAMKDLWIFITAPIIGGLIGAFLYKHIFE